MVQSTPLKKPVYDKVMLCKHSLGWFFPFSGRVFRAFGKRGKPRGTAMRGRGARTVEFGKIPLKIINSFYQTAGLASLWAGLGKAALPENAVVTPGGISGH